MCGIAVVHDLSSDALRHDRLEVTRELGEDMLSRLHHRGPDGSGTRQVGPTWLGHTRLSIVDLDGGEQPLHSPHGERWVVANGEIYNHEALRSRLDGPFVTDSDSEIVLHVIAQLGTEGIHDMRGMYAFGTATRGGDVVLARDPLGVKPLYWARADDRVLAASELWAFPVELRAHVEEFPPGHHWTPPAGLVPFVDLRTDPLGVDSPQQAPLADRAEALVVIRETLVEGVRERMMADVPVGVFLSGGLDSSDRRRDRWPGSPSHGSGSDVRRRAPRAAPTWQPPGWSPSTSAPSTTSGSTPTTDVVAVLPEVVRRSSTSTRRWCAVRCRTSCWPS